MRMRYLGWAGVELEHDGHTLIIDALQDGTSTSIDEEFPAPSRPGRTAAALVTHLHSDHADPVAIREALAEGAPIFRPPPVPASDAAVSFTARAEGLFDECELRPEVLQTWEERHVGPYRIVAGPAIDGLGDPQICWIVECDGQRVLHAGDSMNHAYWWLIKHRFGPVDVAFLPINGAILEVPWLQPPSPLEASMTPEEAAVAGHLLGARVTVPIHYGSLHRPPTYLETPNAADRFVEQAAKLGAGASVMAKGDWLPAP